MTTNLHLFDRTAARFEALTWRLKAAALCGYALIWTAVYRLAS